MADDPYTRQNRPAAAALVVVVLSLTAWFAVYVPWRDGQEPVTETEQAEIDSQMQQNMEEMQSLINLQLDLSQMAIERERKNDVTGQALSIRCIQWTDLNNTQPSDQTRKYQEWSCQRFNHYVLTGEVLPEEPDDS
ncbi:MAG: hypothetical protein AAGA33_06615 [Pseudomonadota bacterium]